MLAGKYRTGSGSDRVTANPLLDWLCRIHPVAIAPGSVFVLLACCGSHLQKERATVVKTIVALLFQNRV